MKTKNLLALLFLAALLVRLGFLALNGFEIFIAADQGNYEEMAGMVSNGQISDLSIPVYPVFISLVYSVFGINNLMVVVAQMLISSLLPIILFLTTRLVSNKRIALIAGVITVFVPEIIFWNMYILTDSLYILLLAVSVYLVILQYIRPSYLNISLSIVFIGITYLTRTAFLTLLPVFTLFLLLSFFKNIKNWIRYIPAGTIVVIFCIYLLFSGIGIHLHPSKTTYFRIVYGYSATWDVEYHLDKFQRDTRVLERKANLDKININMSNEEVIDVYKSQITAKEIWISMLSRLYYFWNIFLPRYSLSHSLINAVSYIPLYVFSLFSLPMLRRKNTRLALGFMWLCVLSISVTHMVTFIDWDNRYRLAVIPFLIIFASIGFYHSIRIIINRYIKWKNLQS